MRQRVRDVLLVSAAGVLVVDGLYAAAGGDIVLGDGHLEAAVVRKLHGLLYQSLAEGARADDGGAVEVLQAARRYLAGGRRILVDQHGNGHHGIDGLLLRLIFVVGTLHATLRRDERHALRHEHVHYLDGLSQRAAAVVAQVEDECLHALLAHVDYGAAHVLGAVLGKLRQEQIAHARLQHTIVIDGGQLYGAARHLQLQHLRLLLSRHATLHLQQERRPRFSAQLAGHLRGILAHHRGVVDSKHHVALLQSGLSRRHALVRFVDDDALRAEVVLYQCADAGVLSREHLLEVLHLVRRVVLRVGVQRAQHRLDASPHGLVRVERVHVHLVEVLVYGGERLEVPRYIVRTTIVLGSGLSYSSLFSRNGSCFTGKSGSAPHRHIYNK